MSAHAIPRALTRRQVLKVAALGGAATALAGCTPGGATSPIASAVGASPSAGSSAGADLKGRLTWAILPTPGDPYTDNPKKIAEGFTKLHPEVQIEFQEIPVDGYTQKLAAMRATNQLPDIFFNYDGWIQSLAQRNVTLDLKPLFDNDPDLKLDNFYAAMVSMMSTIDLGDVTAGQLPLVGMSADVYTMFYNMQMLDEAKLDPPGDDFTYDDLLEYSRKLTKRNGSGQTERWGFGTFPDNIDWTGVPVKAAGGELLDDATQTLPVDENFTRGLDYFWGGVKEGVITSAEDISVLGDAHQGFVAGKIAMIQGAIWSMPVISKATFEFDVARMPSGKSFATGGGTAGYSIASTTADPELAFALIKYLYSEEGYSVWTGAKSVVPPVKSLKDNPIWRPGLPGDDVFVNSVQGIFLKPRGAVYDGDGIVYPELQNAYNAYVVEGKPLADALAVMKERVDAALKDAPAANVPVTFEEIS
jgi:multiple sugar transport system substrate-binding protein